MKNRFPLFLLLLCSFALPTHAQAPSDEFNPAQQPAAVPEYLYCEIIYHHLPNPWGAPVAFDFGQATDYWRYNVLTDGEGNDLLFNSGIQALNYMTGRGWEFVQAYTSGEKNECIHALLRIATDKLPETALATALAEPRTNAKAKGKKKTRTAESDRTEP